jgi:hypothetical protein
MHHKSHEPKSGRTWGRRCSILTMVAVGSLLACGGPGARIATAAMPRVPNPEAPSVFSYDFDEPTSTEPLFDNGVNINGTPIQIWVYHTPENEIARIRVTGHANAEVCSRASLDILELLSDRRVVGGFLTFGVAELNPLENSEYQRKVHRLLQEATILSTDYPELIEVHDLQQEPAEAEHAAIEREIDGRTAVLRFRHPGAGPAFIPIRTFQENKSPTPLSFVVSLADLGVSNALMNRVAPNVGSAPLVDIVNLLRERILRLDRLRQFLREGGTVVDSAMEYQISEAGGSATLNALVESNQLLTRYERYLDATRFLTQVSPSEKVRQESVARQVAAYRRENDACMARVAVGKSCTHHFVVSPVLPKTPEEQGILEALNYRLTLLSGLSDEDFDTIRASQELELDRAKRRLDISNRQSSSERMAAAREVTIDGFLRAWPAPVPDDPLLEQEVDAVQSHLANMAWPNIIRRIGMAGFDLADRASVAGVMARENLFFSVRHVGNGQYRVTPTYVVSGPYLEVYDPDRQTITIETRSEAGLQELVTRFK